MSISILLADDHEIFRQGLQLLLNNQPDFQVVGQAANGLEAVAMAERLHPVVVIVDMIMPGLSGLDVIYQIKQRLPDIKVIVLSIHNEESFVVNALKNGASGYVLKDSSPQDVIRAVNAALAGERFLSPQLNQHAIQSYMIHAQTKAINPYDTLTQREREILHLYGEGFTRPEIAKQLSISVRTVETHRANLLQKLSLHSLGELVAYARKEGIIEEGKLRI